MGILLCLDLVLPCCHCSVHRFGLPYLKVLKQERKNGRYSISGQELDRKRSRRVAHQAILYVGAYFDIFVWNDIPKSAIRWDTSPRSHLDLLCGLLPATRIFRSNDLNHAPPFTVARINGSSLFGSSFLPGSRNKSNCSWSSRRRLFGPNSKNDKGSLKGTIKTNSKLNHNSTETLNFNASKPCLDFDVQNATQEQQGRNELIIVQTAR